jgi:hypothetical protein
MAEIKSRYIIFGIPRPDYLKDSIPEGTQCSGMVFEVSYNDKILYVGLGGGKLPDGFEGEHRHIAEAESIGIEVTPTGNLVADILAELPVNYPCFIYANIIEESAEDDKKLRARLEEILKNADEYSKIMILGDFAHALDGRLTPMLGVYAVIDVKGLKNQH